jgi:KaiC/GvpD/RAD55 family RecA-like ATPase
MVLLFRCLYELRAEEAAARGPVVVVGPPGAGKTTFIEQFLEPRGVVAAEETMGLTPEAEEARGEGLRERAVRLLKRLAGGGYVSRDRVEKELAGIRGAELLKAFDELPRSFVEYLRKRYSGWSLYLFYIPPEVEEEREAVEELLRIAERVGVEFRWFGLRYVPPGVVAMLKEGGGGYVEEQLRLYRGVLGEFGAAGGRLAKLSKLGRSVAEKTGESLLERFAEVAEEFAKLLLPLLPGGAATGAVLGFASYLLAGGGEWSRWMRLLADWYKLDSRLKDLAAAHIALSLGLDRGKVREVLDGLAAAGGRLKALESDFSRLLGEVKRLALKAVALEHGVAVYFLHDVESRGLYVNFYVKDKPYLESREPSGLAAVPLVESGRFGELVAESLRRLEEKGAVVLVGPKGVGKSTLAAYVVWRALREGRAYGVVKVASGVGTEAVLRALAEEAGTELIALYDPSPPEVYYDPDYVELTKVQQVDETLKELGALAAVERRVKILAVLPSDLHDAVLKKAEEPALKLLEKRLEVDLRDVKFLADVVYEYSKCREMQAGETERLAEKIAEFNGGYTLVAKYAGLWLRGRGCDASDVERTVEEAKQKPKLFLARYIHDVLLWRSSDEERVRLMYRAAVPLLLHAVFGPVPEGVTYITQAKSDATFYQPEEIEKLTQPQWDLLKAGLQPIAKWLAQRHEDLVEEVLRDLASLNGEETRKHYKKALGDLIEALDWARDEVLKEGDKILAELGIPEERRGLENSLLAFVAKRLAAVFKSGEVRHCWQRAALIIGLALAGYPKLPTTKPPEDVAEALGDALKPCAVDAYLTIDGMIPPLSIYVARLMPIRELNILSPLADTKTIDAARKTAEELLARWGGRGVRLAEAFYALGLAALAAGTEVDGETADLLLYATPFAMQRVTHPGMVPPVLAALRPLGEKAPHRYVDVLATASELETLYPETVWYIYDALQQLKDRLTDTERIWPLVDAVRAYSNLLRRYPGHIWDRWEEAVAEMCELYSKVKGRDDTTAPESGLSAQRLLDAVAMAYVLAAALYSDVLAPLVRRHCSLGDLVKEAEAVRSALDDAAADPEELRKIKNEDFAEWVTTLSSTGDARFAVENMRAWFTHVLARYKLNHALDEKGELDEKKLEEVAEEFEKAAEISRKLKRLENYLTARSFALRARVLAVKSWKELLDKAMGFHVLWEETKEHRKPTAMYLAAAAAGLGEYIVYLAASGDKERAEKLLKEWRWLLDYAPEVSVATRLMLRLFGVGEGARLKEVVEAFKPQLLPEFWPALLMLAGRLQRDEAHKECGKLFDAQPPEAEVCDIIVAAAVGDRVAAEKLRSVIEEVAPEARPLLGKTDGRTLVEVLAPGYSRTQLAFMLLAAVERRSDAVRLHGLWGSAAYRGTVLQPLFRAVYDNCGDLNSEECRMALLKLYYLNY